MRQVSVAIFVSIEGQNETVREAFVVLFRAYIRPPLERIDLLDLFLQINKRLLDGFDLIFAGPFFKLDRHHVVKFSLFRCIRRETRHSGSHYERQHPNERFHNGGHAKELP